MIKLLKKNEQRGTLMVEAIAMLGLIAMVTPTLYKKSAERLQEIQDINSASQARTMSNSMTAFINANYAALLSEMRDNSTDTIEVVYRDSSTAQNTFSLGYSSFLPYGYKPDEIRSFGEPKVFIHKDNTYVTSYVIYPKKNELGEKRSARLASLVGANGGLIDIKDSQFVATGTGGAWYLDKKQLEDLLKVGSSMTNFLKENSLIVTSEEPVSLSYDDNAQFLYRVPPDNMEGSEYYHNTMVTDLYMGGYSEETDWAANADDYYSIFNVRKLTLNTDCRHRTLTNGATNSSDAELCRPNVADLYIGKPFSRQGRNENAGAYGTAEGYAANVGMDQVEANDGAAWIYGNFAALNSNFRLTHDGHWDRQNGHDVMKFVRRNESSAAAWDNPWNEDRDELVVFEARNSDSSAGVGFMNGFVQVAQGGSSTANRAEFLVGRSGEEGEDGAMLHIYKDGSGNWVHINKHNSSLTANTYINENGGYVHINGGNDGSTISETYINESGGRLSVGRDGDWIVAANRDNSAVVQILKNDSSGSVNNRVFTVGQVDEDADHMIYADKDKVSLRGGNLRVYGDGFEYDDSSGLGGLSGKNEYSDVQTPLTGLTTVTSRDFDVLGRTYLGAASMVTSGRNSEDGFYNRALYALGVAGSAWVDEFLWAHEAWFNNSGFKTLNAGYSSLAEYRRDTNNNKGWLNVDKDRVLLRSRAHVTGSSTGEAYDAIDTRLYADSTKVRIGDGGGYAHFEGYSARLGTNENFVYAGSSTVYGDPSRNSVDLLRLQGSTYVELVTNEIDSSNVIDVQHGAMRFMGHADSATDDNYENVIAAKAKYFTVQSGTTSSDAVDDAQFMVGDGLVRVRYSDFMVEDDSSYVHFAVRPNVDSSATGGEAHVTVDGSFHVTGNNVMHVAANSSQRAGSSEAENHAMFEVDPEYIQVWAKGSLNGVDDYANAGSTASGGDYYAMLKINPYDIHGGSSDVDRTSIYIRKGAIELERSTGSSWAADQGFGYIKANRLVSDVDAGNVPVAATSGIAYYRGNNQYDMFMVNPAYTSVMHDIKLTTRGGARLSDILPDFVLKGVYNVSNDYVERGHSGGDTSPGKRIAASAGSEWCSNHGGCENVSVAWASPFIGRIPFAQCPPGYQNMATMMPISFQMGQAGEIIQVPTSGADAITGSHGTFVINSGPRQGQILSNQYKDLLYPGFYKVEDKQLNAINQTSSLVEGVTYSEVHGWFLGIPNTFKDSSGSSDQFLVEDEANNGNVVLDPNGNVRYTYQRNGDSTVYRIAQPLYFQQNTWLKTSLHPDTDIVDGMKGWDAYMGFVYNLVDYPKLQEGFKAHIYSNNTDGGGNENGNTEIVSATPGGATEYVWNLFPVPTNSLEGHATVYCYFDRSQFTGDKWNGVVDQVDQINHYRDVGDRGTSGSSSRAYYERLNDPTLRYDDPW